MASRIQFRRDTAANWEKNNPLLMQGEIGLILDSPNLYKMGDGSTEWNNLPISGFNGNILEELGNDADAVISQDLSMREFGRVFSVLADRQKAFYSPANANLISNDPDTRTEGKFIDTSNGKWMIRPNYYITRFIAIKAGKVYTIYNAISINWFDKDYNWLSGNNVISPGTVTSPSSAAFLRLNYTTTENIGVYQSDSLPSTAPIRQYSEDSVLSSTARKPFPYDNNDQWPMSPRIVEWGYDKFLLDAILDVDYELGYSYSLASISKTAKTATLYKEDITVIPSTASSVTVADTFTKVIAEFGSYTLLGSGRNTKSMILVNFNALRDDALTSNLFFYLGLGISPTVFHNGIIWSLFNSIQTSTNETISKLESVLSAVSTDSSVWEQGGIDSFGKEQSSTNANYLNRIRTIDFIILNGTIELICSSGYGYRIFEYSYSEDFLYFTNYDSGGLNTHVCKNNTSKIKVCLLKTDGTSIIPTEAIKSQFVCMGKAASQSSLEELYFGMPQNLSLTWTKGEYYSSSGNIATQKNWERADSIDVSELVGRTIVFHGVLKDLAFGVFKNNSGEVVESFQTLDNPKGYYFNKIPAGASQLLICNRWADYENPSLFIDGAGRIPLLAEKGQDSVSQIRNKLSGRKVMFIGDSITAAGGYLTTFGDLYSCTSVNLGVSGTCIANNTTNGLSSQRFVTRATADNLSGASLIVVFGGTNDFSYDSKAIGDLFVFQDRTAEGNIGDKKIVAPTDTDTFAGALHNLISTIMSNAPTIPIVFMTPLNRGRYNENNPTSDESNKNGNYMRDFADAITKICTFYSIPVLDLNSISNLDFLNSDIAAKYSLDGLHPNEAGHTLIGNMLFRFVEQNVVIL